MIRVQATRAHLAVLMLYEEMTASVIKYCVGVELALLSRVKVIVMLIIRTQWGTTLAFRIRPLVLAQT